jgi:dTDP-4-dehydrorhamnose reductase
MDTKYPYCNPEVWGGIECSINRVGHEYFDQFQLSSFYDRKELLHRVADLGVTSLRFPILWEKHVTAPDNIIDWTFADECLAYLKSRNITPIVGLVHHGSGPSFTSLEDPEFPELLAEYALQVATRFPDLQYYTPVNEPLTTARFSGLYGFWFPHGTSDQRFVRMLINQVKGIILSMKAIRKINPDAKLVQTEDLSKIYSTPALQYQAVFENERRWLTYDFLCGKVDEDHQLYDYLVHHGMTKEDVNFFLENPCPPNIMGFNYYITSERFLDDNIEMYPEYMVGGNNVESYVDTEAVRVPHQYSSGLKHLLQEAWDRFGIELALTEVQLHCTREEQLRWFHQAFNTCVELCQEGIPVRAVTAWSVLGAYGWNNLLRSRPNSYEPGVIDLRVEQSFDTQLAKLIRSLAQQEKYNHPLLQQPGWWQRDSRFHSFMNHQSLTNDSIPESSPIFIVGKTGTLGYAFTQLCQLRNIPFLALTRKEFDLTDRVNMETMILKHKPWAIINAAGYVRVDEAEGDIRNCMAGNTVGPVYLAEICARYAIKLVNFSSDLVFDGEQTTPYVESSAVRPLNVYGQSKADMEKIVLNILPESLIIRTSAFFGPWDRYNFPYAVLRAVVQNRSFSAATDLVMTPTYVPDLVNTALDLLIDEAQGIWHISNQHALSWYDWAKLVTERAGYRTDRIIPLESTDLKLPARRPGFAAINSERGNLMHSFDYAIDRFVHDFRRDHHPALVEVYR